jgi:hypothetical protein
VYWKHSCIPLNVSSIDSGAVSISHTPGAVHRWEQVCGFLRKTFHSVAVKPVKHATKSRTRKDGSHPLPTRVNGWDLSRAACKVGKVWDSTVHHIGDFRAQRHCGDQRLNDRDHSYGCMSTYAEILHLSLHLYHPSADVNEQRSHG